MGLAKALFVAIDKLYDPLQNKRRMTKFKDVDFVIDTDIVYDESAPDICKLDTYRVAREGKYPVLFYIHGGGFVAGDKKYRRALSRWSANQGYFVVNVNYGLGPDCLFPEPLRQIVRAFNWVEKHAEELNLDTDRMIVSGDSAGGYYAAMLACVTTNPVMQERLGVSTKLRFQPRRYIQLRYLRPCDGAYGEGSVRACGQNPLGFRKCEESRPQGLRVVQYVRAAGLRKRRFSRVFRDLCGQRLFLRRTRPQTRRETEVSGRARRGVRFRQVYGQPLLLPDVEG